MASRKLTYLSLIKPIPLSVNLGNVSSQPASQPCESCARILPDRSKVRNGLIKTDYSYTDMYPEFPGLKAGCDLCKFIRKSIRFNWAARPMEEWGVGPIRERDGEWDEMLEQHWDGKVKISGATFTSEREIFASGVLTAASTVVISSMSLDFGPATEIIDYDGMPRSSIGQVLQFKVFDSQDLSTSTGRRRPPSSSTLSSENLELIATWIEECKSNHSKCKHSNSSWVPGRLIDVGSPDRSEHPRVIETSKTIPQGPYTALSHMWGDTKLRPPLRTLKCNYNEHLEGIDPWLLPKNFLDAMIVCRQLGIRYVWIDSLCIVQDDPTDWQREAATMHKVYSYAEFTIVATAATSSSEGFLERKTSQLPAVKVSYGNNTDLAADQPSLILTPSDNVESGHWAGDIDRAAWNTRGWTMQERSLSTRMLHFCSRKLYFECRSCRKSEEGEPFNGLRAYDLWPRNEQWMDPSTIEAMATMKTRLYERWRQTVGTYTMRRLTKEFDKLPAIQSIASEMAPFVYDRYIACAGMWEKNLKKELLWQIRDGEISVPEKPRAPTWSWASLDAKTGWEAWTVAIKPEHKLLDGVKFKATYSTTNDGQDQSSIFQLHVSSWIYDISSAQECHHDERWIRATRWTFPYDILTPFPDHAPAELKFAEGRLDLDDRDSLSKSGRRLLYLHIDSISRPSGLILERLDNSGASLFSRVGVASIFDKDGRFFVDDDDTGQAESKASETVFGNLMATDVCIV